MKRKGIETGWVRIRVLLYKHPLNREDAEAWVSMLRRELRDHPLVVEVMLEDWSLPVLEEGGQDEVSRR